MELVGVILWNLWNNQNGVIFNRPYRDPLSLVSLSIAFLINFMKQIPKISSIRLPLSNQDYQYLIRYDPIRVLLRQTLMELCLWMIKEALLLDFPKKILRILEPNVVESYTAKHANQLLHDLGFNKIVLERNSRKVIKMLDHLESNDSLCDLLIDDAIVFCQDLCVGKLHEFLYHLMFLLITLLNMLLIF